MSTMRFPCNALTKRSSSLIRIRGGTVPSSSALHGRHLPRSRAVGPRHFAVGRTQDVVASTRLGGGASSSSSSASASSQREYNRFVREGGVVSLRNSNVGDAALNNFVGSCGVNNSDGLVGPNNGQVRGFGSTGESDNGDDDDAGTTLDDINQKIISYAESGEINKSLELLNQLQSNAISQSNKDGFPDIDSYTSLMNALLDEQKRLISAIDSERNEIIESDANANMPNEHGAESSEEGAVTIMGLAQKAHDVLISMEDISGVSDHYSSMRLSGSSTLPTITTADVAEDEASLRDASLRPTSHHYDSVIVAFANAATSAEHAHYTSHLTKNAPYIAQRWLQRMETLAFDPHSGVVMSVDSYSHVMEACAVSNGGGGGTTALSSNKQYCKAPTLVQSIFDKLEANTNIRPTAREYRLLLRTWCRKSSAGIVHKEGAYKAGGFWMRMQALFRGGDDEMEPTLEDGKMVLEAWTSSVNKHAARRALTILTAMQNLHTNKKTSVEPDLDCYRYALITMSRSEVPISVGLKIPQLFQSLEASGIFPDTECFDCAIETLKKCAVHSKEEDDKSKFAKAAENMLERMEKERDRSSVKVITPSARTYTNAIQALASHGTKNKAEKANVLLKKMEDAYELGDESMRPNRDSYVGAIHAYGHSGMKDSCVYANEVLQKMIAQHAGGNEEARPDIGAFHAVVRACTITAEHTRSAEKRREALLLAISTVQHMKRSDCAKHRPSPATYLLLLQSATSLLASGTPESEKALRSIFRSCIHDGLVDQYVLKEFQSSVSMEVYHREVVRDAPSYNGLKSLPETWTKNLGYKVRTHDFSKDTEGGMVYRRKRNPIISVNGEAIASAVYNDHRMRRRWEKKNQKLLQGGRM